MIDSASRLAASYITQALEAVSQQDTARATQLVDRALLAQPTNQEALNLRAQLTGTATPIPARPLLPPPLGKHEPSAGPPASPSPWSSSDAGLRDEPSREAGLSPSDVERLSKRATLVKIGLLAVSVVMLFTVWVSFQDLDLLDQWKAGRFPSEAAWDRVDTLIVYSNMAALVVGLFTLVVFLLWLHLAYSNFSNETGGKTRFSPAWAVGGFFVPIVNLVRPFQVVSELAQHDDIRGPRTVPAFVSRWWPLLLIAKISGAVVGSGGETAETIEDAIIWDWLGIASNATRIAAAVAAWFVVDHVTNLQQSWVARR